MIYRGKMIKLVLGCILAAFALIPFSAEAVLINFDTNPAASPIANGTIVNSVYTSQGITFEQVGPGSCGSGTDVYANNEIGAVSPPNAVSTCQPPQASDISENDLGMVHAMFATPATQVCIDVIPDGPSDFAVMRSYDSLDQLLGSVTSSPGVTGTLCISGAGIRGVRFSGSGDLFAVFDNLNVTFAAAAPTSVPTMNEWGMIIFMVIAGAGSVYYMRRQRRA